MFYVFKFSEVFVNIISFSCLLYNQQKYISHKHYNVYALIQSTRYKVQFFFNNCMCIKAPSNNYI